MVYIAEDKPTDHDGQVDNALQQIISHLKKEMVKSEDDAIIFFTGDTGTGKSTLLQNVISLYSGVDEYAKTNTTFNLEEYSNKLVELSQKAHEKIVAGQSPIGEYIAGDEFDYQAIENQTKQNRGLDKIFNTVRIHQIFQGLCWPEMEKIPKNFVKNRVKLIFVLDSKDASNRTYILYTKDGIRRMINDGIDSIDSTTLTSSKIVDKYAAVVGWFKENKNIKDPAYKIAKSQAVVDRVKTWNTNMLEKDASKPETVPQPKKMVSESRYTLTQALSMLGLPVTNSNRVHISQQITTLSKLGKIDIKEVYKGHGQYAINENTINLLQNMAYTLPQ